MNDCRDNNYKFSTVSDPNLNSIPLSETSDYKQRNQIDPPNRHTLE